MIETRGWGIIVFLLILEALEAITIVDHYSNDDYEHEVSYDEALEKARDLKLSTGPIPGCTTCLSEEMTYCRDGSVISDHCCCDGRDHRVFPFVEHTCRFSKKPCELIAENCAEYERRRECCCHSFLGSVWKYRAGGVDATKSTISITGLLLLGYLCTII